MHLILFHLLLISSLFYTSVGLMVGCKDWKLYGSGVLCIKCHPGNRLLERSGHDPTKLCKPCDAGYFVTNPMQRSCDICSQCIGPQIVKEHCTASSDTVCGCKAGYRCGNLQCSFCVEECGEGHEPTEERTCRKCPNGTFNDKIHRKCQPQRKSCPEGETLMITGNNSRDNECKRDSGQPSDDTIWPIVGTAVGISVITIVLIGFLVFAYRRIYNKTKGKTEDPMPEMLPVELSVTPEDSWSFRQPEQEQGGSSESISTQDSEMKLIV